MSPTGSTIVATLLVCAMRLCTSQVQINLDCQQGWEKNGHQCYKLFTNLRPWTTAERICASYGGHLATPFDYYENEDIGNFVNNLGVNTFWIGFYGANRMGIPPNDNRVLLYNGGMETRMWIGYWSIYQPKFSDGDCIFVTKDKKQLHKWSFGPCEMSAAFLCQRPVCAQGSFHCTNGNCISPKSKCDGYDDCGDRSDETDCPGNCSWYIRASGQGTIVYPTSGTSYPNNADCSWLIETDLDTNVQLIVNSLSLESNSDELIVIDKGTQSNSMEIVRLTGHPTVPQYYYSSNNMMLVKFRSDGSVSNTGFMLTYNQVNSNQQSQTILTATNMWQELQFPFYNNYVLGNQDLSYVIEAQDPTKTVSIEVLDIDLPREATVLIRNGRTVSDSILADLTGTFKGNGVALSTGRYLYIALHTVRGSQNRGLKIRYMQGCGAYINQSTGYISSPGYPISFYPNSVTCTWTIIVPEAKNVTIYFSIFNVDLSDTIQIKQGSSVLGSYSGNNVQNPVKIIGGQFSVVFNSSATLNSQGFNLTYSLDCPMPVIDLSLSDIMGTLSNSYKSDFTVSCKRGSRFTQAEHINVTSVRMRCMDYGLWNVNTSPKCELVRCPKAPGIQNGFVSGSIGNMTYNGTVSYKCYQGFRLVGSDTITCDANGQWVNPPSCQASTCGMARPADPNGNRTVTAGDGTLFGSVLRYACNDGYDLIGDPTLFCESNGTWLGNASTCQILTCYIDNIPNGVLTSKIVPVGQQVTLTCNMGYKSVTGETIMTCNSNRTFTPMLSCQNINECEDNRICQQQCNDTEGSYYCTCDPGFQVTGNTCTDIDECATISPCNGTCTNTVGSYQCSCPAGHSLFLANGTQGFFIPPTEDGTLPGDVYRINNTCVRNICPTPPVIANTDLLSLKTSFHYEDRVMYKCQLGYNLENPLAGTLSCDENGNWTGPEIKCLRAMCVVDQQPNNLINPGNLSTSNTSISFGDVINITCSRPGFIPQTFIRRRRCTLIGQQYRLDGSVNDYECGFISCGKPLEVPGSNYIGLSGYYYGNIFTFSCLPGFKLEGTSMRGNSTVSCQNNGQWDFGTLICTGIQCVDPGQPYLGQQDVSSDYRQGQLVTFTCLKPGYTLLPQYPLSCRLDPNGNAIFNGSLPTCNDTQSPNFTNCPQNEIFVDSQRSVGSVIPQLQIEDNGGIKSLSVFPAWPSSEFYITSTVNSYNFTYTVTDYGNNQANCIIRVRRKDDTPPTISCPKAIPYLFTSENTSIYVEINRTLVTVKDDVTPSDQLKVTFSKTNYTFTPLFNLLSSFPPTRYEVITATVEDAAGNQNFCNFGLYFKPSLCSPYYIRTPPNAQKTCTAVADGYNCNITCNTGYNLITDITANSYTKSCRAGMAFPSDPDIKCVNLISLDGSYKLEYSFTYEGMNISNSCRSNYEAIINQSLSHLSSASDTSVFPKDICNSGKVYVTGNITLGSLSISETEKKVVVLYVISFDRRPGSLYTNCADGVKLLMKNPNNYVASLLEYTPLNCEKITLSGNMSQNVLVYEGYYCEDSRSQIASSNGPQSLSYCLTCPEGTYSNNSICLPCPRGTYRDLTNMNCLLCTNNTSTYSSGAVSQSECAPECTVGSISDDGLPPCSLCPKNTYWVNATTCLNCPSNTLTKGNGSKKQDECREPCKPGSFNDIDGHAECKMCPMHYYSNQNAAINCIECAYDEYTNSSGKTSSSDCLKLNPVQCLCQHGRCEQHLSHVWSCLCNDGWTGEYCNTSFNPCESSPCYNGGNCLRIEANYSCLCPTGTSGQNCEQIIQTCTANYCQNNGMCENLVNGPRCHCLQGFTGDRCQTAQNMCASRPCKNGGICNSLGNIRFSCSCFPPFTGGTCEENIDDCFSSPCQNNGTCIDGFSSYRCACDPSYTGLYCETYKQMCKPLICGPGAECVEDEINSTYICVCNDYTEQSPGGMSCKIKDFCANNPCMNNGSCISSGSSFTCTCPVGFEGSLCQHRVNNCLRIPCQNGGKCLELFGAVFCNCSGTGFRGETCNISLDNCESSPCNANGTDACISRLDAYYCRCAPGYTGRLCESDVNECDSNPCLRGARCVNMQDNYSCQCPNGWIGKNCETENKLCGSNPCFNGAKCFDYFNGYFCNCRPNTFGKNCADSVNICAVANPCIHGTCQDQNGNAECICDKGYEGDLCEIQQNYCSVNKSICKNDGQCIPELDKYKCNCPLGYLGQDCSIPVDPCSRSQCPLGSTCINFEERVYCRCPLDKEGPNCDKAWDQDFDLLFDQERRTGKAYLPYPIKLNSSSFSISIWLQFGKPNDMGTILSLLTVPQPNSLIGKHRLLWIDEKVIYYNSNGTVISYTHDITYNDGLWHYLVVNVDRMTGVLHFIVDTINSLPVNIPVSETFDNNIWLVLGALWDSVTDMPVIDKGFYGKLSRVTVYSRELQRRDEVTIVGNTNVSSLFSDSILRWSSEFDYSTGVIRQAPSMADKSCPFGYTNYSTCNTLLPGKRLVKIASGQCPGDILQYSSNRLTQVFWPVQPTFTGQDSPQQSSRISGDTFVWGKYPVEILASNEDGNSVLCLFNIFVQNDNCTNPEKPPLAKDLPCSPDVYEKYKQCGLTCENYTAPSIPSPRIHTCGLVGNWDPENRFVPYRITPCGNITQTKHQLVINLRYTVPTMECPAVTETLKRELLKTQIKLNNQWNRVCTQTNCSDTVIEVNCLNKRRKRQASSELGLDVTLTLNDILDVVSSRSDNSRKRTEDLYRDLILSLSDNPFNYSDFVSDAVPKLNSINNIPMCDAPKVFQENQCVNCGPGTFYNASEKECQFCPVGSYQPFQAQTYCIPCGLSTTTATVGSYELSDCLMECPLGQYMDLKSRMCTNCSLGMYQNQSGQFSCKNCPPDKTTKFTGSVSATECSNDCPPGKEIGSNNSCTDCRIGYYRGANDPFCQRCPTGNVTQNISETSVSACNVADNPPGTKRRLNDPGQYDLCPVGTYQNLRWQYDCISCPANYVTEGLGSTNVTFCKFFCPAGEEKKPNEDSCVPCQLAFYRDGSKPFDVCASCPGQLTTLTTGSTSVNNCSLYRCGAGEQPNVHNNGCEPCPKGYYQEFPDMPNCNPCSSGKSIQNIGATKQEDCESYCPSGEEKNGSSCHRCLIGYFKDNNEDLFGICTRCKNSSYVTPGEGSISNDSCTVLNCEEGYKTNQTAQTCDPCPRGTYQDKKYQNYCIDCAQNQYTRHANSTQLSDCETYCDPGYEKNATTCIPCLRGYYKDNTIDVFMACTACDSKYVTPEGPPATNASQCTVRNCQVGTYIDGDNCTCCPKGSFQDKPWQSNCIQCDTNRNTENECASSKDQCLLSCKAGLENDGNSTSCDPCKIGYYKDIEAAAKCTPCANFTENDIYISNVTGSTSISNCTKLVCLAGHQPVNNKCTMCGFGTYQPARWNDFCISCPTDRTTYKRGAISFNDCEYNCSVGEELVNVTCTMCKIGFFNDKSNQSRKECFPCPTGKITQQEGATSAMQCNITDCSTLGQYRDPKDNSCKNCPIGTYQDTIRQDSCKTCPTGYTTQFGNSTSVNDCKKDCDSGFHLNDMTGSCVPCPTGSYRNKTEGYWNCVSCGNNLSTLRTGSDKASDCSVANCTLGTAYYEPSQMCSPCPVNTYAERTGQIWPCTSCPDGQITNTGSSSSLGACHYPCSLGDKCNIVTEVCVNVQSSYRCDCKSDYILQNDQCTHKCDIPNYCGNKGECIRSPFECKCKDGYTGVLCDIRPDASSMSDNETETIIIAVVTTVSALLFLILLVVCICVIAKRRRTIKSSRTSEIDEHTSIATRSVKGYDDFPTFAVNPAFSSKPPSIFSGPNGALPSHGSQMYNPTHAGDEDSDPAVYRA